MTRYEPLVLRHLEEGCLVEDTDDEFARIQRSLCAYKRRWGPRAKGAKAKLTLTIEIECTNPDSHLFGVTTKVATSEPRRPSIATAAFENEDDDDQPRLFARRSGTTADDPKQSVIFTEDGQKVNQETGEVMA